MTQSKANGNTDFETLLLLFFIGIIVGLYAILWFPTNLNAQKKSTLPDLKGWSFSDDDAQVIKHGDIFSAECVVAKLHVLFRKEGKEAVRVAAPALIYRANEILKIPSEETSYEVYDEVLDNIIWLLNKIGDEGSKSVLLKVLSQGSPAEGMLAIRHSVVPDIIDSLGSTQDLMKIGAKGTLRRMDKLDPSFFTKEEKDNIRSCFVDLLGDKNGIIRNIAIGGLVHFGDASTIPILEQIVKQDSWVRSVYGEDRYVNRIAAQKAIEQIRSAQKSKNEAQSPVNSE